VLARYSLQKKRGDPGTAQEPNGVGEITIELPFGKIKGCRGRGKKKKFSDRYPVQGQSNMEPSRRKT